MRTRLSQALLLAGLASGCTATGQAQYSAEVTAPELVYVSPGVQVIADYDEPVFYSDNLYWRFDGGVWYQSRDHRRGWIRTESPPVAVRSIERPQAYIHYHASAGAEVRDHREPMPPPPEVRDHRQPMPPPPPPEVRDHREEKMERKDDKEQRKEERKDDKEQRKEERKDDKEQRKDDKHHGH